MAMPRRHHYDIIFDRLAIYCFEKIESKYDSMIESAIETQLRYEPNRATRNRKPLKEKTSIGASWELRCGPNNRFRVFYDVHDVAQRVVILAIAVKVGNKLLVGEEELIV